MRGSHAREAVCRKWTREYIRNEQEGEMKEGKRGILEAHFRRCCCCHIANGESSSPLCIGFMTA